MPVTISGDGGISGLGGLDGYDLQTQTLVVSGDTTIAPQSATRATLFCDDSTNTVGINTTTPNSSVFLEVADGTDPVVRVNNTGGGNLDIGSTTSFGYVQGSSGHELRLGSNGSNTIVLQGDGDVNIDSNTLYVDISTNRVGIGNNNPVSSLHVTSSDATGVRINSASTQATNTNKALTIINNATTTATISYRGLIYTADYVGVQIDPPQFPLHVNALGRKDAACIGSDQSGRTTLSFRDTTTTQDPQVGSAGNNWIVRTGFTERVRVDTSGRLLVGTDDAITGVSTTAQFQLVGNGQTSATGTTMAVMAFNEANSDATRLLFAKSRSTTQGGHVALNSKAAIGSIRFAGSDGVQFRNSVIVAVNAESAFSTGNTPGYLIVSTTPAGSSSPSERVRITAEGLVGVGSSNPVAKLRVQNAPLTGTTVSAIRADGNAGANATTGLRNFESVAGLKSEAFSTQYVANYYARAGTYGTGSSADSHYGFIADSSIRNATNNYGFYSNISSSAGRWNFYANGSADNYFNSRIFIGANSLPEVGGTTNTKLLVQDASGSRIVIRRYNSDAAGAQLYFAKSGNTSTPDNTLIAADSEIGKISYFGADGADLNTEAVRIIGAVDGTASENNVPGRVQIYTKPDAGVIREGYRLTQEGDSRFGIGSAGNQPSSSNRGCWIRYDGHILVSRGVDATGVVLNAWGNAGEARIYGDGDLENTNNSYTGISDLKLKENITDASSQWDDIKALRLVNFNFKEETKMSTHRQLGLVAQEVEKVSPGLVKEREEHKSVSYSVVYLKAVKALQEAMARIEALESEVSALKSNQVN